MKPQIIIILLTVLVGAAGARIIVIETDPPDAEVWWDGEMLGEAPVVIEDPITESMTITVKKPGRDGMTHRIEIPGDGEDHIYVLSAIKPKANFTFPIITGIVAGLLLGLALLTIIMNSLA